MELNPVSSRKLNNNKSEGIRLPSREANPNPMSSGDNFFRKSSKGFNSQHRSENYGILKSDLFQIQEMINADSYLTKMYKITSKSPSFTKRLTEIEENKDVKSLIEKITEDASNIDRTGKLYNCTSTNELLQKLSLDVFYYELLFKKINELFLVLHLKIGGDDNLYQESFSKFFVIKLVTERLLEKFYVNNSESNNTNLNIENNNSVNTININSNVFLTNDKSNSDKETESEYKKLLEFNSLSDIIKNYKDSDNQVLNHFSAISNNFLDKINKNYNDLIQKFSTNKTQNSLNIENFLAQKLMIEKIITDKNKEIEKLNELLKEVNDQNLFYENNTKNLQKELLQVQSEFNKFKEEKAKEKESTKEEIKNNKTSSYSEQTENETINSLLKLLDESKNFMTYKIKIYNYYKLNLLLHFIFIN